MGAVRNKSGPKSKRRSSNLMASGDPRLQLWVQTPLAAFSEASLNGLLHQCNVSDRLSYESSPIKELAPGVFKIALRDLYAAEVVFSVIKDAITRLGYSFPDGPPGKLWVRTPTAWSEGDVRPLLCQRDVGDRLAYEAKPITRLSPGLFQISTRDEFAAQLVLVVAWM